jgi:hypothetical protein
MIKRLIIIFFLSLPALCLNAQNTVEDSVNILQEQIIDDSAQDEEVVEEEPLTDTILNIYPITILQDTISAWKNKKDFVYIKNLDSLLRVSQEEEKAKNADTMQMPNASFLDSIFNGPVIKLVLWSMAAIFVLVILFQLFKNKGFFKPVDTKWVKEEELLPGEDILEQNFDKLLQHSYRLGDYRTAIRYQFLKTLQILRDKELIDFSVDKTNSRYVHEVPVKWRNEFARLILNYEYVWYGNYLLSIEQYERLQKKYVSFNEKI